MVEQFGLDDVSWNKPAMTGDRPFHDLSKLFI